MPQGRKFTLLLDICNSHSREFEQQSGNISVLYLPPNETPLIQHTDQGLTPHMKCYYSRGFPRKLVNHEGTVKDFQRTRMINYAIFKSCLLKEFSERKNSASRWRKLWPAVMTIEGASDEGDFAGFYVRNQDTRIVSIYETLNRKCVR
jgi:hypothetical protein